MCRTLCGLTSTPIFQLIRAPSIFVDSHSDVTQHTIVYTHAALEFGDLTTRSFNLQKNKRAVFVVQNLVGELAFAHRLSLRHNTTLIGDDLREALSESRNFL